MGFHAIFSLQMFIFRLCRCLILLLILQMFTAKAAAALTASANAENQLFNHLIEVLKVGIMLRLVKFTELASPFLLVFGLFYGMLDILLFSQLLLVVDSGGGWIYFRSSSCEALHCSSWKPDIGVLQASASSCAGITFSTLDEDQGQR